MKPAYQFRFVDFLKLLRKTPSLEAIRFYRQILAEKSPQYYGISLRNGSSDIDVFKQIFIWEEYAYPVKGEVKTIIDAGANIGCSSVWFAQRFPQARIVAVEPEKGNFLSLKKNTARLPQITCLQMGLWHKTCLLKIESVEAENWAFKVSEATPEQTETIPAISIQDIMEQHQFDIIDILKIDIETSEKHLFSKSVASWLPRTKYMFIETHDFMEKGCAKAVTSAVFKYDFSMFTCGENLVFVNNELAS